jgi:hypothetical protein
MSHALYPSLYEIHARPWVRGLARAATLDDAPDRELDRLAALEFDWVWLMGVWQTGPASREISRSDPGLLAHYREVLPDLTEDDICGSPYAVRAYTAHTELGGDAALLRLRQRLRDRGLRLMLDFVPNHSALDHPWVGTHPEFYVHGTEELLAREPHNYRRVETDRGPAILAHGRDPYFPGWTDTFQLNYRHAGLREAMAGELAAVAGRCDGVRCDMAMLLMPDIIARTWGELARPADGSTPVDAPFWPEAIARVRRDHPKFVFLAEVYWDLEWALQQRGFDFTYDKRLCDRLKSRDAGAVRGHLWADPGYQAKSARFLENHDEPRAAAVFPPDVHRAAAVITYLVPGLRFLHEGQLEGRKVRLSVHLARRPVEPVDEPLRDFYTRLLGVLGRPEVRQGAWRLLGCRPAWEGNPTWENFLSFAWEGPAGGRLLVTVNFGPTRGQCYVESPFEGLAGRRWALRDLMGQERYERAGDDLAAKGLYLDMPEWGYNVFEVSGLE